MQVESKYPEVAAVPKGRLWTGRILSILVVLFLLFDAGIKFTHAQMMVQAANQLQLSMYVIHLIGIILLVCTILYAIPQTSALGAVLLTGYLGGAVMIQLRVGNPAFEIFFPVIFGVIVWAALILRHPRVGALLTIAR
jgi:hypothetical protein